MDKDSNRFLSAFNSIEQHLRDELQDPNYRTFGDMVHHLGHSHALVRRLGPDLRHLAELRNFLVHRYQEAEPLAVPSSLSLKRVEKIRDALLQPATLHSLFHKEVVFCEPTAPLGVVAGRMHELNLSQLPIYEGMNFVGLLTSDTIARWLAAKLAGGVGLVEEEPVNNLLEFEQHDGLYEFAHHRTTVTDAFSWWEKHYHKGRPLQAILLTPHGNRSELPTGIVTMGDFPSMLEAVGL